MIRRPPRSTLDRSSAASDVYKRQVHAVAEEEAQVGREGVDVHAPAEVVLHPGSLTGTGSVSYTHLRAHETVLDLVCRLLLEKKKSVHIYT